MWKQFTALVGFVAALVTLYQFIVGPEDRAAGRPRDMPEAIDGTEDTLAETGAVEEAAGNVAGVPSSEIEALFPGMAFRDCPSCPEMVVVPAGEFLMGSSPRDEESLSNEHPQHLVQMQPFALGRHEITRGEYAQFVAATNHQSVADCYTPSGLWRARSFSWRDPGFEQRDNHPVVCISWLDAKSYVQWLSAETGRTYRLPSEAEWEYAVRAGTVTPWYWGDSEWAYWDRPSSTPCGNANIFDTTYGAERFLPGDPENEAVGCSDDAVWTAPVGSYMPNAFGVYDMIGNVVEWVEDCRHLDYVGAPRDGTAWTQDGECNRRVIRGGSWHSVERDLRSSTRYASDLDTRSADYGFRVARPLN